jgi:hypothetical protein
MKKVTKNDIVNKFKIPLFCNWDGCAIHVGEQYVTESMGMKLQFPNQDGTVRVHAKHMSSSERFSNRKVFRHGADE